MSWLRGMVVGFAWYVLAAIWGIAGVLVLAWTLATTYRILAALVGYAKEFIA